MINVIDELLHHKSCVVIPCPITGWTRHDEMSSKLLRTVREAAYPVGPITITWSDDAREGRS